MKNFKKVVALVLAFAMVLSMGTVAFAADNATEADVLYDLGLFQGYSTTEKQLGLEDPTDAYQAITLIGRALGWESDVTEVPFADVPAYAVPYVAYAVESGITNGVSATEFGSMVDGKRMVTWTLRALGYNSTDAWEKTDELAAQAGLAVPTGSAKRDMVAGVIYDTLSAKEVGATKTVIEQLIAADASLQAVAQAAGLVADMSDLMVKDVMADTAKSFKVTFNRPVTDDDKVTFEIKRLTTALSVTTTWNEDMTEAVLASSTNLAQATFTVKVMADEKEIASEAVAITAQKVAKVEFTSESVAVAVGSTPALGYVTYKTYDQYGNDITSTYLSNNMNFQSGAINTGVAGASITGKNGVITLNPGGAGTPLLQFPSISIVIYDTNAGVSVTASLPTANAVGTLSAFELGSTEDLALVEGDSTSVFYLPYTAKDMSGNETKDYNLVSQGLIFTSGTDLITTLPGNVTAQLVKDPANSRLAAIEIKVKPTIANTNELSMDMPVTITAMTYNGGSTSVETTLVKAKALDSFALLAPANTVTIGEDPELQYEAYDQFGNKITKYADIKGKVTENGFTITKKVDGSAKVTMTPRNQTGITMLSATVTSTGKISMININVQDTAKPARIEYNASGFVAAMEHGAIQGIKLEKGKNIKVYDQFDREMSNDDIKAALAVGANYDITAMTSTNITIAGGVNQFDANANYLGQLVSFGTTGKTNITTNAVNGGSGKVTYSLIDTANNKVLDSVVVSVAIIKSDDIKDYTISEFADPIYASITTGKAMSGSDQEKEYAATVKVYGETVSGSKVMLAGTPVVSTAVENKVDFNVQTGTGDFDDVKISANELSTTKTSATTVVTVNLLHNNDIHTLKTSLSSSYTAPVATDIVVKGTDEGKEVLDISNGDLVSTVGKFLSDFNGTTGADVTEAGFWFLVKDSYGKEAMQADKYYVTVVNDAGAGVPGNVVPSLTFNASTGEITGVTGDHGDVLKVTATTDNGLQNVIEITIQN